MMEKDTRISVMAMKTKLRDIMKDSGKSYFIYSLMCPVDNKIRWIGYTRDLKGRFETHWNQPDWNNILKWGWILALKKRDQYPDMSLLKGFSTKKDAVEYEKFMIFKHRKTVLNKNIPKL